MEVANKPLEIVVYEFKCLGMMVGNQNYIFDGIKSRLNFGSAGYFLV
jgi:hypothetical protein